MEIKSTSYRCVIEIIGTDPFFLRERGGVKLEKLKNLRYF